MKINAVKTLSETQAESAVILGRIKDQDGRMTAEMASEHVKALEDQRVKSVDQANQEYAQKVAVIEQMRDELGVITADQATIMIAEAERQRTGTIEAAQATKDRGIKVLEDAYDSLRANVDVNTGKMLTAWDRAKAGWNAMWFPEKRANIYTNEEAYLDAVNRISGTWARLSFPTKYALVQMEYVGANMDASIRDPVGAYNGLSYVPYDGFQIRAHEGERLLNKKENKAYNQETGSTSNGITQELHFYGRVDSPYEVAKAAKQGIEELKFMEG